MGLVWVLGSFHCSPPYLRNVLMYRSHRHSCMQTESLATQAASRQASGRKLRPLRISHNSADETC